MVFNTGFLAFVQGLEIFSLKTRRDDDYCDRLSHHHTALFLLITSVLISSNQYVGSPINCWVPKEFSGAWQKYANNYCWIKNTYIVPPNQIWTIPQPNEKQQLEINYYQWVPIVLLCQALLFYFPSIIWRMLNWTLGINIQDLIDKAMNVCTTIRPDVHKSTPTDESDEKHDTKKSLEEQDTEPEVPNEIKDMAYHLELSIKSEFNSKGNFAKTIGNLLFCGFGSRKYGFYLITLYMFTKVLYIINVVGQLFLLNSFIGTSYKFFGFQMLNDLAQGNDWKSTGHFPRITLCDFEIRNLGQRTNYTVQCVLPINLFNEKIYIFIWFWIFIVSILTVYSLFQWVLRMMANQKFKFVQGLLEKRLKNWSVTDSNLLKSFLDDHLKTDGVFLMYLIYLNAGDLVTKELLDVMWYRYKKLPSTKVSPEITSNYPEDTQFL